MEYDEFLKSKQRMFEPCGFECIKETLNPMLFPWQRDVVYWALKRGRSALFEDCGLGKTPQQLEWAHQVCVHTGGNVLLLTPLAVSRQTMREAKKFGIDATVCKDGRGSNTGIIIVNYERLHYFDPKDYAGIILDESSILKAFDGKTRKLLQDFASNIPYRLCCTATPAPNDLIELTNHAEFLGIMSYKEIISLYFKQDGNSSHDWRLKKHAVTPFWKWLSSWSVAIRKPSDIGYDDGKFILPELHINSVEVGGHILNGELFPVEAQSLLERRQARRKSQADRVKAAADIIAKEPNEPWLVWCDLNSESEALTNSIPGAQEVKGSDPVAYKEKAMIDFSDGKLKIIVTKPSIAGHGMNWQHCARMIFVGLSDSYEQFYQALRRCWRFGQTREVHAYVVTASTEGAVVRNIKRKEAHAMEMFDGIVKHMSIYQTVSQARRELMEYKEGEAKGENWRLLLGDSVERIKEIQSDSIGLSAFSPPFPGMYAYTNSERDIGNVTNTKQLIDHFGFMMRDLLRITMPGRICAVHLTQEPLFKGKEGHVGLFDFRGELIRRMVECGWIYYSEITIDKNPMLKASRTKESTLLFKTLSKDSASSRPALADYIVVFKKDGENDIPIQSGTHERWNPDAGWITADEWCEWASPVWYRAMPDEPGENYPFQKNYPSRHQSTDGIMETDVLQFRSARDQEDERHLCPLQLGVIERVVKLWSAPGDTVFSPFAGIGSEGYKSILLHRKFVGIELKESYFKVATQNLQSAERKLTETDTPLLAGMVVEKNA